MDAARCRPGRIINGVQRSEECDEQEIVLFCSRAAVGGDQYESGICRQSPLSRARRGRGCRWSGLGAVVLPASLLLSAVSPVSSYSDHRAAGAAACLYRAISARAGENGLLVLLPIPRRILPIRQGVSGWLAEGCAPILRQDSVRRNQS